MSNRVLRFAALLALSGGVALAAEATGGLDILTRAEWGAKEPVLQMKENAPKFITVHHTATAAREGRALETKLRNLQNFSQSKAPLADGRSKPQWGDIPYHFYVDISGEIGEGLESKWVGDTNTEYDPTGHVSIVVEGNFENEEPSAAQLDSIARLMAQLSKTYDIPPENWGVHQDYASTACPGKHLLEHWDALVAAAKGYLGAAPAPTEPAAAEPAPATTSG